jgi:hypothetical protein
VTTLHKVFTRKRSVLGAGTMTLALLKNGHRLANYGCAVLSPLRVRYRSSYNRALKGVMRRTSLHLQSAANSPFPVPHSPSRSVFTGKRLSQSRVDVQNFRTSPRALGVNRFTSCASFAPKRSRDTPAQVKRLQRALLHRGL